MRKSDYFNINDKLPKIVFVYVVLIVMSVISLYPLLNVLSIALRPGSRLFQTSLKIIPDGATLENFSKALLDKPFCTWLVNSLVVTIVASFITIIFSFTAAYALSRFKFRGKNGFMTSFLITQIFPAPMLLLPTFVLLKQLKLLNNYWGLIIPYVATAVPFCVWTLKGFFDTVPFSIEESAYLDGANLRQIFFKIITPLSLPALGVASIFALTNAWNEYIIARLVLTKENMITLPVALTNMQGQFNTDWGIFAAASLITGLPIMIVFIALSRFMQSGLTLGGVKG